MRWGRQPPKGCANLLFGKICEPPRPDPPGAGTPSRTRHCPDQAPPLGPETPLKQVPPGAGTPQDQDCPCEQNHRYL